MASREGSKQMLKMMICSLSLVPFSAAVVNAQQQEMEEPTREAQEALVTFRQLINERNFQAMGFESVEQVANAALGVPMQEFMVRLDELQDYTPDRDPNSLIRETGRLTYPVLVEGRVRSSLTLENRGGVWVQVAYGAPARTRLIEDLRSQLANRQGREKAKYIEVSVPALKVTFVGSIDQGRLYVSPLSDDPRFEFERATVLDASEAFGSMVQTAREREDVPG